jgi:PII-like signaling protein
VNGIATLMRIFVNEGDRYNGRPLFVAVVEELRRHGVSGATVLKAIEGFGRHRIVRAARCVDFAENLPILIEVAETEERIAGLLPALRAMIAEGLVTVERVEMHTLRTPPA